MPRSHAEAVKQRVKTLNRTVAGRTGRNRHSRKPDIRDVFRHDADASSTGTRSRSATPDSLDSISGIVGIENWPNQIIAGSGCGAASAALVAGGGAVTDANGGRAMLGSNGTGVNNNSGQPMYVENMLNHCSIGRLQQSLIGAHLARLSHCLQIVRLLFQSSIRSPPHRHRQRWPLAAMVVMAASRIYVERPAHRCAVAPICFAVRISVAIYRSIRRRALSCWVFSGLVRYIYRACVRGRIRRARWGKWDST